MKTIVVGVNGSEEAARALQWSGCVAHEEPGSGRRGAGGITDRHLGTGRIPSQSGSRPSRIRRTTAGAMDCPAARPRRRVRHPTRTRRTCRRSGTGRQRRGGGPPRDRGSPPRPCSRHDHPSPPQADAVATRRHPLSRLTVHADRRLEDLISTATRRITDAVTAMEHANRELVRLLEIRARRPWNAEEFATYLELSQNEHSAHRKYLAGRHWFDNARRERTETAVRANRRNTGTTATSREPTSES